jgi:hypothetical protein
VMRPWGPHHTFLPCWSHEGPPDWPGRSTQPGWPINFRSSGRSRGVRLSRRTRCTPHAPRNTPCAPAMSTWQERVPCGGFRVRGRRTRACGHRRIIHRSWAVSRSDPCSPPRPERSWTLWSSAFAAWAATHITHAVRPRRVESLRPGHVGMARGDGEAPNQLAGEAGAPTADAAPGEWGRGRQEMRPRPCDATPGRLERPPATPSDLPSGAEGSFRLSRVAGAKRPW